MFNTIHDKVDAEEAKYNRRVELEKIYNEAKARKDWTTCSKAVEAMRILG